MSDSDLPPPPPVSPPSDEQDPREPAGGSLKLGILAATGLGVAAFLITYALTPRPDVDGGGMGPAAEAWLTFTFVELPLLLVIAAVLLSVRRTRRTGGGMMIGAAVAMIVTTGVCGVAG